jgi:hypothetical protein
MFQAEVMTGSGVHASDSHATSGTIGADIHKS